MKTHIVGKWWFDNYSPNGPFFLVTFYPDGRYSLSKPSNPEQHNGYWRVDTDGTLLLTQTKDALPGGFGFNEEIFVLDHMTDTEMFFGHPDVAGLMTFKKITSDTTSVPIRP